MNLKTLFVKYIKLREKLNNAKVYKIVDNTNDNVYIGSTCKTLKTRLSVHKSLYKRFLKGICNNVRSFNILKNNDYKIELIEKCDIKTKEELLARERFYIENNNCLNKNIPGRTNKEFKQEYYLNNKDKLDIIHKDYYFNNKEKIAIKKKEYTVKNNEKLKEKFVCQCGGRYTRCGKSQHIKTTIHLNFLETLK